MYSIICNLKEIAKRAKIKSLRKLPDTRYEIFMNLSFGYLTNSTANLFNGSTLIFKNLMQFQ